MDVAMYRGRGAEIVLVHAAMRPPRRAEQCHGPLRYLDTVHVDGNTLAQACPGFSGEFERNAYAVVDESDGLRLLRGGITPSPPSILPG